MCCPLVGVLYGGTERDQQRNQLRSTLQPFAHDAVIRRKARVNDISRDYPSWVDGPGHGAVIGACAFPRNVQGDDGTVRITHEAVRRIARVKVPSAIRPLGLMATG